MYKFLILAYDNEIKKEDQVPFLERCTEIYIVSDSAAAALSEAKNLYISKNYFIRKIEKIWK
jgi:hypothetical protein